MNKYLKILALSGGLIGAIAPTAINVKKDNNDFYKIYENVEKMQNVIPRLSKINYQLNIGAEQDENIKFINTDEFGNETELNEQQTINQLNEALVQTNLEYEQLKQTLITAINDTMDYLDKYNSGELELSNEQKLYIKEHSNSIKFLAETLEDLSEEVMCTIDDCCNEDSDCPEQDASKYISTINELELRINALQNSLNSLLFINSFANPYIDASLYREPNRNIYGLQYGNDLNKETNSNLDDNNIPEDTTLNSEEEQVQQVEQNSTGNNIEDNNDKPTTFGLKSNIDTYAPTKRNIDTFFNTALYNNDYLYRNSNYMPYGYGGGYGYGMPYGGAYGSPYGLGEINSNMVNRSVLEQANQNQETNHEDSSSAVSSIANIETDPKNEMSTPKKIRAKRAKNVDTYTDTTIKSNINTMGESKIAKFFKDKFNNIRNKVRSQKDEISDNNFNVLEQNDEIDDNTNLIDENADKLIVETSVENDSIINENSESDLNKIDLVEEKQIQAK